MIQKLRASYSNVFMASVKGTSSLRSFGGDRAKHVLMDSPTQSLFFEQFSQCLRQPAIHALLDSLEQDWSCDRVEDKEKLAVMGAFMVIAFGGSFQGTEVFLVDLFGI
jgi:hypothetical protein